MVKYHASSCARTRLNEGRRQMNRQEIINRVHKILDERAEIAFAYIHGSSLLVPEPHDVDIAVYLRADVFLRIMTTGSLHLDFAIPLEIEIEKALGRRADVQVINQAPLSFRARVSSGGVVVVDNDSDAREAFEHLSRYEYFDFRPRRQEYLAEVMA